MAEHTFIWHLHINHLYHQGECLARQDDLMAKRRTKQTLKQPMTKLLDVRLVIQVGMILFAIVGFYFTTKSRLDVIENNMSEIKSSLTDSRLVKLEMRLEELAKDLKRIEMNLMSLEDWIEEDLIGDIIQQKG